MSNIVSFCKAAVAGTAITLQGTFSTAADKVIGVVENTLLVHLTGAATVGLILLFGFAKGDRSKITEIPWYGYMGGILSAVIVFAVISGISALGVGNATVIIILFQIAMALIIDSFGPFGADKIPFSSWCIVGMALLVIGTKCVFYKN